MKKPVLYAVIAIVILVGGFFGYSTLNKNDSSNSSSSDNDTSGAWNPYASENHYIVSLSDQLLSSSNGSYIVKMSVSLDFVDAESYYKFKGYSNLSEAEKSEKDSGGHGSEEGHVSAMELKINDTLGSLMMRANDTQLTDREMLRSYLKDGLNKELNLQKPIIKDLYIENFILQ